jgi:DNA-binding FadR family transcriptional regulator
MPSLPPSTKKEVTTWTELEDEVEGLQEFYWAASDALDEIRGAIINRDPAALRRALRTHGDLKARAPFSISSALFEEPLLRLVN